MLTFAIIGLGSRGRKTYLKELTKMPERAKVVAVADPDEGKLKDAAEILGLSPEYCFSSADALLEQPKLADAVLMSTPTAFTQSSTTPLNASSSCFCGQSC